MRSAYAILGIPGNATGEEINQAFEKALTLFPKERLVEKPELAERVNEIRDAHKILSNTETRQAHDRKLNAAVQVSAASRPRVVVEESDSVSFSPLKIMALVLVAMLAIGGYVSYSRDQTTKALAAQELELKRLEMETAARESKEKQMAESAIANARATEANRAARERQDGLLMSRVQQAQQNDDNQRQGQLALQADQAKANLERQRQNDEQRRVSDARRQLETDKNRIRELCWQNYRKYDC